MGEEVKVVTIALAGAGDRGFTYSSFALEHPERASIVAVAEPREFHRKRIAELFSIPSDKVFASWDEMAAAPKLADCVIIATQDNMHTEPAVTFAEKGYSILLEKPMAPTARECIKIADAVRNAGVVMGVCHVLRYTAYTRKLKKLIASGAVGEIVSVQHLEPVGYWHQAHSFVRGNWRNSSESSFMLLAKSCHDMDWLRFVIDKPCLAVSSFGSLKFFKEQNRPSGAGERCTCCCIEKECPYSAVKLYFGLFKSGKCGWPVSVVAPDPTEESLLTALNKGPYGRCVFMCDNDVVDHQVMNMLFEDDVTATFTMTAFNKAGHRKTRIFGTAGEIEGNGCELRVFDFLTDSESVIDTTRLEPASMTGHGGGDYHIMEDFIAAVASKDQSLISSGPEVSLESHLMAFAGEKARLEGRVVELNELSG
jgi:predicted dehydrogenase